MSRTTAVDFERPPVTEVACGVVFDPVPALTTGHIGLLWSELGREFPKTADRLPIVADGSQLVQVGADGVPCPVASRVWFVSADDQQVLQVQQDRVHLNWRRIGPDDAYPRFEAVYAAFVRNLVRFRDFVGRLGELRPRQFELTYINVIAASPEGPGPFTGLFRDAVWPVGVLPVPSSFHHVDVVDVGPDGGKLRVVRRSVSLQGGRPASTLEFTVFGPATSLDVAALDAWFDKAHETIIDAFVELTDTESQDRAWKRRA
jgi:uncharacterized protein (TIGR04255 family)